MTTIYFFLFEAIPCLDNPEKDEIAGAFIACWVDSIAESNAKIIASDYIKDEGWEVIGIKEQLKVNRDYYEGDIDLEPFLEYFEQAIIEGIATIYFVWTYHA